MFDNWFRKFRRQTSSSPQTVAPWPRRWVVLDTETTGLSLWRDHLLSIAAVAVTCDPGFKAGRIVLSDRFEVILHQEKPTHHKSNILIHHIGIQAQLMGEDATQALSRFLEWLGDAPVFAFHAPFDKAMIVKACKHHGLPEPGNMWLDVAALVRAARRDSVSVSLDERLQEYGLQCFARHHASADTFATAELLLHILPVLREQVSDVHDLMRLCADYTTPSFA